ncbi:MAG: RHS repeat protein, partial [Kiritimatiellae bacterium]|nr:RHS repeat protein [Kiritimatiellia bacterium]
MNDKKREIRRQVGDEFRRKSYDKSGNLVQTVLTNRQTSHFCMSTASYDSRHRVVASSLAYDAMPTRFRETGWDDISGEPRRVVSPAGRVSEWTRGEHSYVVYGAGANDYRLVSSVSCDSRWRPVSVEDSDGGETRFSYGADGHVSRVEADGLPSVDIGYDMLGHVSSLSMPGPDAMTRTVSLANNWKGRPISVLYPDGTAESFAYDGNGTKVVRHVDRLGREDAYKWVLGLPVHAGRVIGGVTNTLFGVEHDKQLNVVSITDPLGRKAEAYVLDANDCVVAVTNVEGQVMTRSYAVDDLVESETRFDGTSVTYDYDVGANLSSVVYPDDVLSFSYDADGLLTSASNSIGLVTNLYDAATGWLDASYGVDGTWVEYVRSDGGAVTSMTSVAGTTAYSLDAAGRRTRLAMPSAAFDFGYCEWNGRLAAVTNASGFVVQYTHDIMDRVTNISWRTASGATLGGFAYEYDALGRITSRSHTLGDPSQPSSPMSQSSQ